MQKIRGLILLVLLYILGPVSVVAVATPASNAVTCTVINTPPLSAIMPITALSVKSIEKLVGRRLSFKEKIAFKLLQWQQQFFGNKRHAFKKETNEKIERQAIWAKWLGIGSLIGLFIPGVGLLSLPAAIVAIVLGADTIRKTDHPSRSRTGIIFGIITISLMLIVAGIVLLVISLPVR